ncbi:ATP-binding protein [Candidatus Desantisbacteria bacterium]|nr:ATP-binding protein [Candidatus Desantisbacteria bacterium]
MINREILSKILPWLGKEKILILKGARQVGKTTILNKIKEEVIKKNPDAIVVYLSADDIENQPVFSSSLSLELYLKQLYKFPEKYIYLLIDEFQYINQAGLFLKNVFDKYKTNMQLIVSGSSSLEITKNIEFLTGRAIDFKIERVSFKEFFDYINNTKTERIPIDNYQKIELFCKTFFLKIEPLFKEYLIYGGYPEVLITEGIENKKIILSSIIKTYIEKDIVNFLKIENVSGFNNLVKALASQIGNLVNISELSNTVKVSINTLNKYLDILTGTYIFNFVTPYTHNIRNEISKMPKVYVLDSGIRNYLLRIFEFVDFSYGSVIENFVYLTMLSQYEKEYIHFYRTISGSEIDFVIEEENNRIILCEVKYVSRANTPLAIRNLSKKYPEKIYKEIIITKDLMKKDENVYFIPALILPFVKL